MEDIEKEFLDAYNTHSNQIFRFVFFRLSDREKAKELTQETFLKTWVYISKTGAMKNIKAFLYKIASNLVVDEYRRGGRAKVTSLDLAMENGHDFAVEEKESLLDKLDGSQILGLVKLLPKSYADVLYMKYVEDMSISEIAEAVGGSNNVVSVRINRGMRKLKKIVSQKMKQNEH